MARLLALLAVLAAARAWAYAAAPPCNEIARVIAPCMAYLSYQAWVPYGRCCAGVAALNGTVATRGDRVAICNCFKSVVPNFPGVDFSRTATLLRLCGVLINITISPSIDCSSLPPPRELQEVQH
ncbi:non-specific lipid-transfer protein 1-like [Phoenix dactylifera]|uniref:Non-specific lipid-transfer protein n=1 Tax=Phoenix dactylifera TaxID=42345 RepID=A0A8B9AFN3_PHODC|nr:non-specific lipid-transfer protein 1-like [Phoenix dactylifera]